MSKINLRGQYPDFYKTDYIIEVSDEVVVVHTTIMRTIHWRCGVMIALPGAACNIPIVRGAWPKWRIDKSKTESKQNRNSHTEHLPLCYAPSSKLV